VVLGAALALAVAELVIRRFYDAHMVYDPELGYLHAPGISRYTGESPPAVSTWTLGGLRRKSPPDTTRPSVLVLGDSFSEASMIDDGKVYTDRLEADLPEYQFLNAGRATMSAADYTAFAPVYMGRLHPRWTIIQVNPSDLAQDAFSNHDVCYFSMASDGELTLHRVITPHKTGPTYWLRDRSMLAYFLWMRYGEYRQQLIGQKPLLRAASPPPTAPREVDYPVEAVMDRTAEAYGRRVTFAILAPYVPESPLEEPPLERRIFAHCKTRGYSCVSTRSGYAQFAREGRAPFGFATSSFNAGHMNEAGHALLARVLEQEIEKLHAFL
jgi:hypothetical protein